MNVLVLLSVVGIFGILGCSRFGQALRFVEEPTSIIARRNRKVSLQCTATAASKITIYWRKDGVRIQSDSDRVVLSSGDLVLRRFRGKKLKGAEFDEGTYQCFASTKEGTILSRKARVQLAVLSRAFKEWPKNATIWRGETARLICQPKRALPDPGISWEKDGQKITPGGRYIILPNGVLQILQVQDSDEGQYRCVAQNIVRQTTSDPGWLTVQPVKPPVRNPVHFAVIPGNMSVISGHQVTMECIATGMPIPTVQWKKVGSHNEQNATSANKGSSNLQIPSVSVRDRGEYLCVISWGGKTIRRSAFLFVKEPPHFIVKPPTNDVATAGRTIKLACTVIGSPMPNITWLKDGQPIAISRRISTTKNGLNGNLTIKKASEMDNGVYQCFAENSLGSTQSSTRVIVKRSVSLPPGPRILSAVAKSDSEVNVTWAAFQAHHNIVAYAVTFRPVDNSTEERSKVERNTNCILQYLQGHTKYSLYVTAFFKTFGRGPKSASVTVRTLEGRPKSPPTSISLSSYTPDSIDVRWVPPSKKYRNGILTGYIIRYFPKGGMSKMVHIPRHFTQMTVNGLSSGQTYSFEVAATTSVGVGPFSPVEELTVATKAYNVISAPNMSISPKNSTALEVTWNAPLYGANRIQNYKLSYTKETSSIDQHGSRNIDKTKNKFLISGLSPNTKYIVRLMAWDGHKLGQPSVQVGTTLPGTPTGKPGPQNGINAKCQPYSPTTLWISWQTVFVPRKVNIYYQIHYEVQGNINHKTVLTKKVSDTNALLSSLRPGWTYHITVKPYDSNDKEILGFAGSTVVCDTPEAKPSSAPRNVRFKIKSKQSLDLSWEPPLDPNGKITNYVIAYTINVNLPDEHWKTHEETVLRKFFSRFEKFVEASLQGLSYNSTYFVKIKAGNKEGYGPYSNPTRVFMIMDKDRKTVSPPKLTFKHISSSVVQITWRHPVSPQGKPVRYSVIYTTNPTLPRSEWFQLIVVVKRWAQKSERSVSVQLANLSANQTYYVKVQADYGTLFGPWSNQLIILTNVGHLESKKDNNSNTNIGATSSDSRTSSEKEDFEIKLGIIIGCVISAFCIVVLVLFIIWRCPCSRFAHAAKNHAPATDKKNGVANGGPNRLPNGYSVSASHQSVESNRLGQSTSYEESSGGSSVGSSVCQCRCTCSAGRWPQLSSVSQPQSHVGNGHIKTGNGHLVTPNQGPPQSKPYSMPLDGDKVLNGYVLQEPPVPLQILTVQENGKVVVGTKPPSSKSISVDV